MTYLVTGATGKAGRQVVHHLRAAGMPVRALSRDPVAADLPADVDVVRGDLTDLDSMEKAFDGVLGAHLLAGAGSDHELSMDAAGLAALAEAAGVQRATLLWNGAPGPLEQAFADSRVAWTRLEPVSFMGNTLVWADDIRAAGVLEEPFVDETEPMVDEHDIGAVAAKVLVEGGHGGRTYVLTGGEPISARDRLQALSRALDRPIGLVELTEAQARSRWADAGYDAALIDALVDWQLNPPAQAKRIDPTVQQILGRPARTFDAWLADHLDDFR